jgi:hypothetical protein
MSRPLRDFRVTVKVENIIEDNTVSAAHYVVEAGVLHFNVSHGTTHLGNNLFRTVCTYPAGVWIKVVEVTSGVSDG